MTDRLCVQWTLTPIHPPQPWRHCATCGVTRAFVSSGKVRLNANGRRLDAWLIYRCVACDRTWLRTLLERRAVREIPQAELDAMQHSSPAWVRQHEFDITALKREADTVTLSDDLRLTKSSHRRLPCAPSTIELKLVVLSATGLRLDRFLSSELSISRARLHSTHAKGGFLIEASVGSSLRRKIVADVKITLFSDAFSEVEFSQICRAVIGE